MKRITQSPTGAAFVQNPYPFYATLRAMDDLVWWEDYALPCATSHAAVNAFLRDTRFGREVPADLRAPFPARLAPFYAVEAHSMLELDAPRHTRLRALVLRAFTSRRIKALVPDIKQLAHQLIDRFPEGDFDLLAQFCQRIPVLVISRLLGVPETRANDLLAWSNAMVTMYQAGRTRADEDAAIAATLAFVAFMHAHVETRRARPGDDLITQLITAEEAGEKLTTDELITTCILLLNAGHEATVHALGNAVKLLLETRNTAALNSPRTAAPLVEETLRFAPPLHLFTRVAKEDAHLYGHDFRRGDQIACLLACANRDESVYSDPERFDPMRPARANTSFGGGAHFCVGAPLARLELLTALPILFARCPRLRLSAPPRVADVFHFHGHEALMVRAGSKGAPFKTAR